MKKLYEKSEETTGELSARTWLIKNRSDDTAFIMPSFRMSSDNDGWSVYLCDKAFYVLHYSCYAARQVVYEATPMEVVQLIDKHRDELIKSAQQTKLI